MNPDPAQAINHSFAISAIEGTGVDALIAALTDYAKRYFAQTEATVVTRARHRQALEETVARSIGPWASARRT